MRFRRAEHWAALHVRLRRSPAFPSLVCTEQVQVASCVVQLSLFMPPCAMEPMTEMCTGLVLIHRAATRITLQSGQFGVAAEADEIVLVVCAHWPGMRRVAVGTYAATSAPTLETSPSRASEFATRWSFRGFSVAPKIVVPAGKNPSV